MPLGLVATALAVSIAACAGRGPGTGQPYYGPGTGSAATTGAGVGGGGQEFLYVCNSISNDIAIYKVDAGSGGLAPINSNNIGTGDKPLSIAPHPQLNVRFMYVGNGGTTNDIWIYKVDKPSQGNLLLFGSPLTVTQGIFVQMKFRGDGKFLYVLTNDPQNTVGPSLSSFDVDPINGGLTAPSGGQGGTQTVVRNLNLINTGQKGVVGRAFQIDRTNTFAYVALSTNQLQVVAIDAKGGLSLPGNPIAGGPSPSCLAINLDFVYTGSDRASSINVFDRSSGTLTLNPNSIPTRGTGAVALAVPVIGGHLYCVNGGSGDISFFDIQTGTGILVPTAGAGLIGGTIDPQSGQPGKSTTLRALAINSSTKYGYTLDNGKPPMPLVPIQVSAFQISSTGELSPVTPGTGFANSVTTSGSYGVPDLMPDGLVVHY